MKMLYIALLCMTITTTAEAVVITNHRDYTPENSGGNNAAIAPASDKSIGFVTCGGNNFGGATSLGCKDYTADGKVIPWKTYPGYRLGANIPASYRVTAMAYDSYNHSMTVYFEY